MSVRTMPITKGEVIAALQEKYIFMDDTIRTVVNAIYYKKNCILYGPRGHAKSAIVEDALTLVLGAAKYYEEVYVAVGGLEADEAPFNGYLDLKTYQETGIQDTILSNTIYVNGKKYAVLEEGLDYPGYVLETMKDRLQRGMICINGTCVQNTLQSVFICTNHDPLDWALNSPSPASYTALLDRFPYRVNVSWPDYSAKSWAAYFDKVGTPSLFVASLMEKCHSMGDTISPRAAKEQFLPMYLAEGLPALKNFGDFSKKPEIFAALLAEEAKLPYIKELEEAEAIAGKAMELWVANDKNAHAALNFAKNKYQKMKKIPSEGTYTDRMRVSLMSIEEAMKDIGHKAAMEYEAAKQPRL